MLRLRVKQTMADAVAIGRVALSGRSLRAFGPGRAVGERPAEQSRFDAAVAAARRGVGETWRPRTKSSPRTSNWRPIRCSWRTWREKIAEGMTAADAVHAASGELAALFAQIDDEYLRGARRRCTRRMSPHPAAVGAFRDRSLSPRFPTGASSPPTNWHRRIRRGSILRVRGVVTRRGSATSHLAILARNRNLPAVVGLGDDFDRLDDGTIVVLDGPAGELLIAPDEHTAAEYRRRMEEAEARSAAADAYASQPVTTRDGRALAVLANAGSVDEVERAIRSGADGIGLFRSEFLYMQRQDGFPDEQVQTAAYARAAELCGGRPLVIRTLDIGGDKSLPYYRFPEEENRFSRLAGHSRKPRIARYVPHAVAGDPACQCPGRRAGDVSDDRLARGVARRAGALEECKEELRRQEVPFDDRIPVGGDDRDAGGGVHGRRTGRRGRFFSASAPTTSRSTCWPSIGATGGSLRCTIRCIRPWCARCG